ncbi:MAG TPA: CDP-alcohol phosphatidyltransferase family protein [Steroidobacteraceae bacterium]|nr:CDP-alcohol phosphatidyltransferase family protein [Steroidobacteraceae bacterium]
MTKDPSLPMPRAWDARLGRHLVEPLKDSRVTPNHLTTLRLGVGLAGAAAFVPGTWGWTNLGALLVVLSNFLDHTDGELARISGRSSRFGHFYDLASDAAVTVLLFVGIGAGLTGAQAGRLPLAQGAVAGMAVALIFFLRMQIEERAGKAATRQAAVAGFETEDVLYLLPLVTLFAVLRPFLLAASIGAPLFALYVVVDYVRVVRRPASAVSRAAPAASAPALAAAALAPAAAAGTGFDPSLLAQRLAGLDTAALARQFDAQGRFLYLPQFLPEPYTARLVSVVQEVTPAVNRNYLPGHKQGGSVSRHAIDSLAPFIAALYHSPQLLAWLGALTGEGLQVSPPSDPHAYALYFYTRPGDHIGWHYDTSYYAGRRYTLLLGVLDRSSCRLDYELHTREPGAAVAAGSVQIPPGGLVVFDGDRLHHRITPLAQGEARVSLTFEYLTDPGMHSWWRFVSNMKDAVAYFGFRQVFRRLASGPKRT